MSSTRCMIPQPFTDGGNMSYLEFWAVTSGPLYPGYKTLTVALEPSIDWAVETILSAGGRIGTHMLLWEPSRDSVVRPRG
jgi:hypothetical protein